jgi:hypothetical protein
VPGAPRAHVVAEDVGRLANDGFRDRLATDPGSALPDSRDAAEFTECQNSLVLRTGGRRRARLLRRRYPPLAWRARASITADWDPCVFGLRPPRDRLRRRFARAPKRGRPTSPPRSTRHPLLGRALGCGPISPPTSGRCSPGTLRVRGRSARSSHPRRPPLSRVRRQCRPCCAAHAAAGVKP